MFIATGLDTAIFCCFGDPGIGATRLTTLGFTFGDDSKHDTIKKNQKYVGS